MQRLNFAEFGNNDRVHNIILFLLIIASQKHFQTGRKKVPLCSTGLRLLWGRCPATPHTKSQSCKAGQQVLLTTYCPWATCCNQCLLGGCWLYFY